MLQRLYIKNYALLDELEMEIGNGLNILTGETGAGKSLLIGALGLILGNRLDYSYLFNPDQKCIVEAGFSSLPKRTLKWLKESDAFDMDDEQLVIRREATAAGKSRAFINDTPVSLSVLKSVTSRLVDLHGQHENQMLLSKDLQLDLLDEFCGVSNEVIEFSRILEQLKKLQSEIQILIKEEAKSKEQLDYFQFQFEELDTVGLVAGEDQKLEDDLQLLENAEEIQEVVSKASDFIYENEQSLYAQISEIANQVQAVESGISEIEKLSARLEEAKLILQDTGMEFAALSQRVEADPRQLEIFRSRVDLLNKLKLKFSVQTSEELIVIMQDFESKIAAAGSMENRIAELKNQSDAMSDSLLKLGLKLEQKRKVGAKKLTNSVNKKLSAVGLNDARFSIELIRNVHTEGWIKFENENLLPTKNGLNKVGFNIQTNPGIAPGPLSKVASGGEVSRIMLAIKSALAERADLSVLIFDEIDTGISGETAKKVAAEMKSLSEKFQLIAITHLPQIAAKGNIHFQIFKEIIDGKTLSRVKLLKKADRVQELAKMLSGAEPTASALKNAKELIEEK